MNLRKKLIYCILAVILLMPLSCMQQPVGYERTVYVTRTGGKYHRSGCRYLRYSKIPMSLLEVQRYYSACSVCRP